MHRRPSDIAFYPLKAILRLHPLLPIRTDAPTSAPPAARIAPLRARAPGDVSAALAATLTPAPTPAPRPRATRAPVSASTPAPTSVAPARTAAPPLSPASPSTIDRVVIAPKQRVLELGGPLRETLRILEDVPRRQPRENDVADSFLLEELINEFVEVNE